MVGATLGMTMGLCFAGVAAAAGGDSQRPAAEPMTSDEPGELGELGLGNPTIFDELGVSPGQAACLEVTVAEWDVDESSIMDDWVAVLHECGLNPGDIVSDGSDDAPLPADQESESDEYLGDGSPALEPVAGTWSLPPITYNIPPDAQTITDQ